MDEILQQAYHEIIYELLINPAAKSALVLKKSSHLIDQSFIEFLGEMSTLLAERNCPEDAEVLATLHQQLEAAEDLDAWISEHSPQPVPAKKPTLSPQQLKEKAEQLFQQGTQHFKANEYNQAIQAWQQALPFYQKCGEIKEGINCLGKLGNLYQTIGQYQQAIAAHQRALGLSKNNKYARGEANALNSLGQVCTLLGQYDRAIACYQDSLEISQRINFKTAEIQSLNYLGQVHYALAEYQPALDYHQQALDLATKRNFSFAQAYSLSSLGHTYAALQNLEQAIEFYQQALTLFQAGNHSFPQASCLRNIGLVHQRLGNTEQALTYTNTYLELALRLKYQVAEANAYLDLAEIYTSQAEYTEAIASCQQSLETRQGLQDLQGEAKTLNCLGKIYQVSQQPELALEVFKKSLELADSQLFPQENFKAAQALGDLAVELNDWELAITAYLQVIKVLESHHLSWLSDDQFDSIECIERPVYHQLIQVYIQQNQLEKAVETVERFRSYQLVQSLSNHQFSVSEDIAEDLELYQRLQRQMTALHFRRQSDEMKPLGTAGLNLNSHVGLQIEAEALTVLNTETQKIWKRLQETDSVLAAKLRVISLNFSEIKSLVSDENTAILSIFMSQTEINIFIINSEQVHLHRCVIDEIEAFNNGLNETLFKPSFKNNSQWKDKIGEVLLKLGQNLKLSQLVSNYLQDIQELIIIPDFSLHWLPFAALPVLVENQPEYLGDQFHLRIIPNCQLLHYRAPQQSDNLLTLGIAAIAGNHDILKQYTCQKIAQIKDRKEIKHFNSEPDSINQFQAFIQSINSLYANHSIDLNLQQPRQTQWQLLNESLTLEAIMKWDLSNLSEAFLSHSKIHNITVYSMPTSVHPMANLLYCGVQKVITNLWNIDPFSHFIFSQLYYQNRQTYSIVSALQTTQNQLRNLTAEELAKNYQPELEEWILSKQTKENQQQINDLRTAIAWLSQKYHPFANPYYWAGYILHG
ncbi:MAG: tetratricopeptide repeat protein [Microcoleaceae cyanobacterium]